MSLDPVALLQRYHGALNRYEEAVLRAMFATDAVYVSPGVGGRLEGRDAIIKAFSAYFAEHPDQQAEDERVEQAAPNAARATWRLTATSTSSGARIIRQGVETVTFGADGLIRHVEVEDR